MASKEKYKSWSLLSPAPINVYLSRYDEYVTFINGIVLTHRHATQLILEPYGIYASPEVKRHIEKGFKNLYSSGALGDEQWDLMVYKTDYYLFVRRSIRLHLQKLVEDMHINDALKLLDTTNAATEVDFSHNSGDNNEY